MFQVLRLPPHRAGLRDRFGCIAPDRLALRAVQRPVGCRVRARELLGMAAGRLEREAVLSDSGQLRRRRPAARGELLSSARSSCGAASGGRSSHPPSGRCPSGLVPRPRPGCPCTQCRGEILAVRQLLTEAEQGSELVAHQQRPWYVETGPGFWWPGPGIRLMIARPNERQARQLCRKAAGPDVSGKTLELSQPWVRRAGRSPPAGPSGPGLRRTRPSDLR